MSKSYILRELIRVGFRSDKVKVKRCVLCSSDIKNPDMDCPVCRVIVHVKLRTK